ncbi:MAG: hypothetical protein HKN47_13505 [Pirellulaceae bacterium]|nr:hypothetical protein [Pirellulaceae bacterium]
MARSMKSGGRLWCVLAISDSDSNEQLAQYGAHLERFATNVVVTCQPSMKGSFLQVSHSLLDGVEHCASMRLVADHQRAIQWAVAEAKPSDTILVLGGGAADTAHQQRTDFDQIAKWVEAQREVDAEAMPKSPAAKSAGDDGPMIFSIFDGN